MSKLVHNLITSSAERFSGRPALKYQNKEISYLEFNENIRRFASLLINLGLHRSDRVAIYAEKRFENITAMFSASLAGGVFVPVNPLLKAEQVLHILNDCQVRVFVTTSERLTALSNILTQSAYLTHIIVIGPSADLPKFNNLSIVPWSETQTDYAVSFHRIIDQDMAAILYTSGSTGKPKGVVLSHRNIVAGAESVAEYLELTEQDRILSVLPLSFDYGLNQLTTMFLVGGMAVLMNYLFPRDIITALDKEKITGLAAVPPLWIQLSQLPWPPTITEHLRYITNSGGHMPKETLTALRRVLPKTKPFLMYGLTESFRSTYLPPSEIDRRPDSMGKAIPNAEIFVVRPDGSLCQPHEPGQLVHRGVHVSLGYWNDPAKTAERFKPLPNPDPSLPFAEMAVWSGDTVKMDEDGFLYFISRDDEMIKTTGYRISPTEIEEFLYGIDGIEEAAAFGIPHPVQGQVIGVIIKPRLGSQLSPESVKSACQKNLPSYMVPAHIEIFADNLPRTSNGKIDRKNLALERQNLFKDSVHG